MGNESALPRVTRILKEARLVDTRWFSEVGAWRGSVAHKVIELHCKGDLDESSVDPRVVPYFEAYKKFERDMGWRPQALELRLSDALHGYRGTPDQIGKLSGIPVVLDLKSGAIIPATALQLAAYANLAAVNGYGDCARYALRLSATGRYTLEPFTDENDWEVFKAALLTVQWRERHGVLMNEKEEVPNAHHDTGDHVA